MTFYKIVNINDSKLFWSNAFGWCDRRMADSFTKAERDFFNLPIEGKWFLIRVK